MMTGLLMQALLIPDLVASIMMAGNSASDPVPTDFWLALESASSICSLALSMTPKQSRSFLALGIVGLCILLSSAPIYSLVLVVLTMPVQRALNRLLSAGNKETECRKIGEISLLTQMIALCAGDLLLLALSQTVCCIEEFQVNWVCNSFPSSPERSKAAIVAEVGLIAVIFTGLSICRVLNLNSDTHRIAPAYSVDFSKRNVLFFALFFGPIIFIWFPFMSYLVGKNPLVWMFDFIFLDPRHIALILYWIGILSFCLPLITWASKYLKQIVARKLFHLLAVAMFIPATFLAPELMSLAYAVAVSFFFLVELIRYHDIQPLAGVIHQIYKRYLDERDGGPLVLTHLYLLLGCAIPCWISLWLPQSMKVEHAPAFASIGVIVLGVGDTLAAVVGSTWGHHKWPKSQRTFEGSCAMFLGVSFASVALRILSSNGGEGWRGVTVSTVSALFLSKLPESFLIMLLEAFTSQIDNLLLPLYACTFYLLIHSTKVS